MAISVTNQYREKLKGKDVARLTGTLRGSVGTDTVNAYDLELKTIRTVLLTPQTGSADASAGSVSPASVAASLDTTVGSPGNSFKLVGTPEGPQNISYVVIGE